VTRPTDMSASGNDGILEPSKILNN
jgi:hypothetical protein